MLHIDFVTQPTPPSSFVLECTTIQKEQNYLFGMVNKLDKTQYKMNRLNNVEHNWHLAISKRKKKNICVKQNSLVPPAVSKVLHHNFAISHIEKLLGLLYNNNFSSILHVPCRAYLLRPPAITFTLCAHVFLLRLISLAFHVASR